MKYVPKEQVEEWKQRDPIDRQEHRLQALGVDVDELRTTIAQALDDAVQQALGGPMPSPEDVLDGVFCDGEAEPLGDGHAPWSGFARGDA
jgi:TPP-dependent pyruvate/acetoin dehydrogenase alpha subunit